MQFRTLQWSLLALCLMLVFSVGCNNPEDQNGSSSESPAHDHSAHDHEEGPAGGHLIKLKSPDGKVAYQVEWLHDDEEDLLTFIVRDADAKDEVPIEAKELIIDMVMQDDPGKDHQAKIPAAAADDTQGKVARFELADKTVMYNVAENDKVTSTLKVDIDGVGYEAEIEHHHHGHDHGHHH